MTDLGELQRLYGRLNDNLTIASVIKNDRIIISFEEAIEIIDLLKEKINELDSAIVNIPTIDIVRCEVCKYWSLGKELTKLNGELYTVGYCCLEDKYSNGDWFCADGERKPALKHADKETLQSAT